MRRHSAECYVSDDLALRCRFIPQFLDAKRQHQIHGRTAVKAEAPSSKAKLLTEQIREGPYGRNSLCFSGVTSGPRAARG